MECIRKLLEKGTLELWEIHGEATYTRFAGVFRHSDGRVFSHDEPVSLENRNLGELIRHIYDAVMEREAELQKVAE